MADERPVLPSNYHGKLFDLSEVRTTLRAIEAEGEVHVLVMAPGADDNRVVNLAGRIRLMPTRDGSVRVDVGNCAVLMLRESSLESANLATYDDTCYWRLELKVGGLLVVIGDAETT